MKIQILSDSTIHPFEKFLKKHSLNFGLTIDVNSNSSLNPVSESFTVQDDIDITIVLISAELLVPNKILTSPYDLSQREKLIGDMKTSIDTILANLTERKCETYLNILTPKLF